MDFHDNSPIYQQIVGYFRYQIVTGRLSSGERIKSVRDYAIEMGVNPNTMQKAMSALEQENLIKTERTAGRLVTQDQELIAKLKKGLIKDEISEFLEAMAALGYNQEEAASLLRQHIQSMEEER